MGSVILCTAGSKLIMGRHYTPLILFVSAVSFVSVSEGIRLPVNNGGSRDVIGQLQDANSTTLISGGGLAQPGQFPWQVSLQATNCERGWHLCGGTLITSEWVLTAAHCLDHEKPEWLWVVTGDNDLSVVEGTEQYLLVDFFIQHPDYKFSSKPYPDDVGLIHLKTPANINTFTQPARLPSLPSETFQGPCVEYGWGQAFEGVAAPQVLHFADNIPLRDPLDCTAAYSFTHPNMLCAGQDGVGFCTGDNGGGLQIWSTEERRYVIGAVLSWRAGCAEKGKPGVYMNIPPYLNWIKETIARRHPGQIHNCDN